eukprot:scaffold181703_cov17-Tisochrysis_lutea.AAC.1
MGPGLGIGVASLQLLCCVFQLACVVASALMCSLESCTHLCSQVGSLFKANKMTTVKDGGHPDFARVFNGKKVREAGSPMSTGRSDSAVATAIVSGLGDKFKPLALEMLKEYEKIAQVEDSSTNRRTRLPIGCAYLVWVRIGLGFRLGREEG